MSREINSKVTIESENSDIEDYSITEQALTIHIRIVAVH